MARPLIVVTSSNCFRLFYMRFEQAPANFFSIHPQKLVLIPEKMLELCELLLLLFRAIDVQ